MLEEVCLNTVLLCAICCFLACLLLLTIDYWDNLSCCVELHSVCGHFHHPILQIHTPHCTPNLPLSSPVARRCGLGSSAGGCLDAEIFNSLTPSLAQHDSCQTWQHKGTRLLTELCVYKDIAVEVGGVGALIMLMGFDSYLLSLQLHYRESKLHFSTDSSWIEEHTMSGRKTN